MARSEVTLTNTYQQIAPGRCVISFSASGVHSFNDVASDTAARRQLFQDTDQVIQTDAVPTFARTLSGHAVVIVDTEG